MATDNHTTIVGNLVDDPELADREQRQTQVADLASRPCRAAWSATGPAMLIWPRWSLVTCSPSNQADQLPSRTPLTQIPC